MKKLRLKTFFLFVIAGFFMLGLPCLSAAQAKKSAVIETRSELPELPVALAGQFVGVSDGRLLVINGTNWTKGEWGSRRKTWRNKIYALENDRGAAWREIGEMPAAVSYGAAITDKNGVICLGGQMESGEVSKQVFRVALTKGKLNISHLPDLPRPLAYFGAALLGRKIYVAGGQASAAPAAAEADFYELDLDRLKNGWVKLAPLPAVGRILPSVVAEKNSVYVIGGTEISPAGRHYLADGYRYQPTAGWSKIRDLPETLVGAPVINDGSRILVFGGDTGNDFKQTEILKDAHPGFSHDILIYDSKKDAWTKGGSYPAGLVTVSAVRWRGRIIIAGGEDRPRSRSAEVVTIDLEKIKNE